MKFAILVSLFFSVMAWGQKADEALAREAQKNTMASSSQKKVTVIADKTRDIVYEYREILRRIENARMYNHQMRELIQSQKEEMVNIRKTIVELKQTNKEILPFTLRLLDSIKKFVILDVPFLPEERSARMNNLEALMDKANVSTAEKFRRILEAYQIENDYGRSMEAYKGVYKSDGKELTVDYLRVGRIFLGLQSIDGSYSAYWDIPSGVWKTLPGKYEKSLAKGIKIARKMMAPDLVRLPIVSPTEVQVSTMLTPKKEIAQ